MYDKDNDYFRLSVRDLNFGSLCTKPQADRVSNLAWAKGGQALLYTVTDSNKRPYRFVKSLILESFCLYSLSCIGCYELKLICSFLLLGFTVA